MIIYVNIFLYQGPKMFMTCPESLERSELWFMDLWNYSLVPYLAKALQDGNGKKSNQRNNSWEVSKAFLFMFNLLSKSYLHRVTKSRLISLTFDCLKIRINQSSSIRESKPFMIWLRNKNTAYKFCFEYT